MCDLVKKLVNSVFDEYEKVDYILLECNDKFKTIYQYFMSLNHGDDIDINSIFNLVRFFNIDNIYNYIEEYFYLSRNDFSYYKNKEWVFEMIIDYLEDNDDEFVRKDSYTEQDKENILNEYIEEFCEYEDRLEYVNCNLGEYNKKLMNTEGENLNYFRNIDVETEDFKNIIEYFNYEKIIEIQ